MKLTKEQLEQIKSQQSQSNQTKRVTAPELEKILYEAMPALDHGFVRVVDYMGDDTSIVQSARVSYGKGTKQVSTDKGLIKYLMRHWHSTPFEMCEIKYHVKLPIFIARQWIRHRTANVNEYSARYSILEREFYIPSLKNLQTQSKTNNQGRGENIQDNESKEKINLIKKNSDQTFDNYSFLLNEDGNGNIIDESKDGIARELARMTLPLNTYTQWYWKVDLHNLMHFLSLRFDVHAQYEIRVYADIILNVMKKWVPLTYDAFLKYRMEGFSMSSEGVNFLKSILKNEKFDKKRISNREINEIIKKFDLKL